MFFILMKILMSMTDYQGSTIYSKIKDASMLLPCMDTQAIVSTVFLFCTGVRKLQLHHGTAFRVMRGADVHTQMSISARCRVIVRSKLGQIQRGITEGMWKKRMLQHSGNQDNSSQIFWQHVRTAVYFFLVAPGLNKSQRKCEKFKQRARRWLTYLEEVAR